ncbi:NAD-dependent epimerase/dehydratase family protein [Stenotrophomonas sp. SY1]|uniref:NAD-dependent epimerase/dehydratase family protein n=1 Tax=Stenotrophomonas sp. SY1 TaxID=477235 RepID=UPI001E34CAC0|nr:NAD-dependent epimerase/dehydratase family protein [Stenotrophomonas sp. SY1]MCD9088406.1 NAD-dependent epimerase/dehydratase family protein [Stenotrophomonas sp. SY1]
MRVLIAGATGLVGAQVLRRLLADPRCSGVVAPTRRPLAPTDAKLLNPVLDFATLPADAPWYQVDAAVCALGSTMKQAGSREAFQQIDHGYPLQIAQAVRRQGCEVFALNSAMGAKARSPFFYNRVKGQLEEDLRALGFSSLALVRPGLIGGERAESRAGEHAAAVVLGALAPMLPKAWRINPAERIADALVEAALNTQPGVRVIGSAQLV